MGKKQPADDRTPPPTGPNGCRRMRWVPDPEAPPQGWLHVTDLDGRLWSRGVSRTRFQDWVLLVDIERKKHRGKV